MATYLHKILEAHRAAVLLDRRDPDELAAAAADRGPARGFRARVVAQTGLSVIAEIKRRSPSKGDLAPDLDATDLAARYVDGGATCLSVLTDGQFFGGSVDDLVAARSAGVPVLRKDFTVCANDVYDARIMGADAVLLIVAALDEIELPRLLELATRIGLDALVEVHDEGELDRALAAGAELIGVNQRDLVTFAVDPARAERLAARLPADVAAVAESGVQDGDAAARLAAAGFDAVLVGESLVTAPDPLAAVAAMAGHPVGRRSRVGVR